MNTLLHTAEVAIVVSHADVIKTIVCSALGLSVDAHQRFTIDPASIPRWHREGSSGQLSGLTRDHMASMDKQEIRRRVQALEPWCKDMDTSGGRTAPEHFLYGYPETGSEAIDLVNRDYEFFAADHFNSPNYPKLHFIESACSGDPSNWWAPNAACSGAMLRSAGFEIRERPESEVYICRRSDCLDHVDAAGLSRWLPE